MSDKQACQAARRWLSDSVGLRVVYDDDTPFGAAISGRCERLLHQRLAVLHAYREKFGLQKLITESAAVLGRVLPDALADLHHAPGVLRDAWLYPPVERVRPAYLRVEANVTDMLTLIPLAPELVADLASLIGSWQHGAVAPAAPHARALWNSLAECGALTADAPTTEALPKPGMSFVGHATLRATDGRAQVIFDPFLVPRSTCYPVHWQPASAASLGRPDAVFITHSHPDHFDPGTLLRWGADVPIYVPAVARESVLAIDMAARLVELGFKQVHAMQPWQRITVGDLVIDALPFYGEQPSTAEVLHPEVRNVGLTYTVTCVGQRVGVFADSGLDHSGDVRTMVGEARARDGAIDTVFGGYRGFAVYPVQFLFSSVSRYLPFVPAALWAQRQQIMCDASALIDVAERAGARRVVPYADGGAPWFWLRGLGPNLNSNEPAAMATDPPPQHVADVAAERGYTLADGPLASPVAVEIMQVGDHREF